MRLVLHAEHTAGSRAGKILLAERDLTALGLYGKTRRTADRRTMNVTELGGFDVFITDAVLDAAAVASIAADEGLHAVLSSDTEIPDDLARRFAEAGRSVLTGANLASGIALTLGAHEQARTDADIESTIAWTVPGKSPRKGEALPFPDPVGARWGVAVDVADVIRGAVSSRTFEAPGSEDTWAGAMSRVRGTSGGEPVERVVGVADHGGHLAGIALAAGAIAVAEGAYLPGRVRPVDAAEEYLAAALRVGLEVATFTAG